MLESKNFEQQVSSPVKRSSNNELGCKIWASSCIVLNNGTKFYVDNTEENIRKNMDLEREVIEVELTKIISEKILRISIKKEQIKKYYSVRN